MKSLLKKCLMLTLFMATTIGTFAGEYHYGNGSTREAACEAAERRAKKAAETKGTCWEECDVRACVKETDGTWTCKASSANHSGSCP